MEGLKRERKQLRRFFTISLKDLETKMDTESVMKTELIPIFKVLEDKADRLFEVDERIKTNWLELELEDFDEDEFGKEVDLIETYRNQWITIKRSSTSF